MVINLLDYYSQELELAVFHNAIIRFTPTVAWWRFLSVKYFSADRIWREVIIQLTGVARRRSQLVESLCRRETPEIFIGETD